MRILAAALLLSLPAVLANGVERISVPMRDGVKLSTLVQLPSGNQKVPTILIRTPYPLDSGANPWVEAGYAVVQQNLRGLFASEGKWTGYADGRTDGFDTVEWIAAQPWSNGKVGILGAGGSGTAAYQALLSGAPHLSAGVVRNAAPDMAALLWPGGVFQNALAQTWPIQRSDPAAGIAPFAKLDEPITDGGRFLGRELRAPILHAVDLFHQSTSAVTDLFYEAHLRGTNKARHHQMLLLTPPGDSLPSPVDDYARRWFDYWLRDIDTGIHRLPEVRYYALNGGRRDLLDGEWKTSAGWPPASRPVEYHLISGGGLSANGPSSGAISTSFDYDPSDPVPSTPAPGGDWTRLPAADQAAVGKRPDVASFTTLPLREPVSVEGWVELEAFVSTTAEDTDLHFRLVDIDATGVEDLILAAPLRLRFRDGLDNAENVRKNKVYKVRVRMGTTAYSFSAGHRIRVQITSSDAPRFERHSNTWLPVHAGAVAVKATNTIHHAARHPSRLILPVIRTPRQRIQ